MPSLLIISPHFPPSAASGSFRMLGFSQNLPALGWKVSVVTRTDDPWEPIDPELSDRVPSDVQVHSIPYKAKLRSRLTDSKFGKWSGIWDGASIWVSAVKPLIKRVIRSSSPDVVLTSGPPHSVHLLGHYVKRLCGAVWAADFRDPWAVGRWHGAPTNAVERHRERSVVESADLIIANAPRARDAYRKHYPQWSKKFVVITNGFDPAPLPRLNPQNDGRIRILHMGEIYAGRDPRPLLDALSCLQAEFQQVEIDFVGRVEEMKLEDEVRQRGLVGRVHVRDHVANTEAHEAMAQADILLLMDTSGRKVGIPAKLYEYIGSGRPVLALAEPDSDTAWALQESGVPYALASPQNIGEITAAMTHAIALTRNPAMGLPPQAAKFTRANTVKQLSVHLSGLLAPSSFDYATSSKDSVDQASPSATSTDKDGMRSKCSENK